jgi:tetratricopeptide (TPR) repeat protein
MTTPSAGDDRPARRSTPQHQDGYADRGATLLQGAGDVTYVDHRGAARPSVVPLTPPQRTNKPAIEGRHALLDELAELLSGPSAGPRVQVLTGMGGVGKTTVATELARRASAATIPAWWISAVTGESVSEGMQALAVALGVDPRALRMGSVPELVWAALHQQPGPWLLVFDNADDPDQVLGPPGGACTDGNGWLRPVPSAGMIVVTSRDGSTTTWDSASWLRRRPVPTLDPRDGASVLLDQAPSAGTRPEAELLSERLGGLPLALHAVGAYLAKTTSVPDWLAEAGTPRTFTQYQAAIESGAAGRLFSGLTPDQGRTLVARTWELSLDLLTNRGVSHARPLLRLLSCFFDAPVPVALLADREALRKTPHLADLTGPECWDTLHALAGLGLVELQLPKAGHPAEWTVTLHPLVRAMIATHPDVTDDPAGYPVLAIQLVKALAFSKQAGMPEDPSCWPWWRTIAPHAPHLFAWASDHEAQLDPDPLITASRAAYMAGRYLSTQGDYGRAATAYEQVLAVRERVLGVEHPETLGALHVLAWVRSAQGDYARAATTYEQVLAVRERVLGVDHPNTLKTRHDFARLWHAQGDYARAASAFEQVLAVSKRVLGAEHPDTLTTRHNLAVVWHNQGEHVRAVAALEQVIAVRNWVLGEDHKDTVSTRNALAVAWYEQGQHARTAAELKQVLNARVGELGANHPDTLATRHALAVVWNAQGDHSRAVAELEQVLAIRERVLGVEHPQTVNTRNALATANRPR